MTKVVIPEEIEALASKTVNAALAVHRTLGPGLLESAYAQCMAIELAAADLSIETEKLLQLVYRGRAIDTAFRVDLIVGNSLLVELKAVETLLPVHTAQVITYLKLLDVPLGLLINFNVPLIKDGIHRVLNLGFRTTQSSADRTLAPSRLRC